MWNQKYNALFSNLDKYYNVQVNIFLVFNTIIQLKHYFSSLFNLKYFQHYIFVYSVVNGYIANTYNGYWHIHGYSLHLIHKNQVWIKQHVLYRLNNVIKSGTLSFGLKAFVCYMCFITVILTVFSGASYGFPNPFVV